MNNSIKIVRHVRKATTEATSLKPVEGGFVFDEAAIKKADQITLGDLLTSTSLNERTIAGVLMLINYARTNLFNADDKTDEDKCLQVDLQDVYRLIGQDTFDEAFAKSGVKETR